MTILLDYIKYKVNQNQGFSNNFYDAHGEQLNVQDLTANQPSNIDIYSAKIDYTHSLSGHGKWEAGVKSSYVNTDDASNYFNVVNGKMSSITT